MSHELYRIEVFDCPEQGFSVKHNRIAAESLRDWLIMRGVEDGNIRIVKIDSTGRPL